MSEWVSGNYGIETLSVANRMINASVWWSASRVDHENDLHYRASINNMELKRGFATLKAAKEAVEAIIRASLRQGLTDMGVSS